MSSASVVWVSGGSSGIGAAFLASVPDPEARVIDISRRGSSRVEHLAADLADPASWPAVEEHFAATLGEGIERAIFFHCAGSSAATGPAVDADPAEYTGAALLNSVAGQALGRAFLAAVAQAGIEATLVTCSSPAAVTTHPGLSQYCAGKAALEAWTRVVALEAGEAPGAPRIFSVSPRAVDTAMVRATMEESAQAVPLSEVFRKAAARGALATPEQTAEQIWKAIEDGVPQGAVVPVGALAPREER